LIIQKATRIAATAFCNGFALLGEDEFNVTRHGHVRVDAAVGSVSTATHGRSAVDLDVRDEESFGFEALDLSVAFGVLQQIEHVSDGFLRPATGNGFMSLGLGVVANTSQVTEERNGVLALEDIFEEALSFLQRQTLQVVGSVKSVFVMDAKVGHSGLDGFGGVFRFL